MPKTFQMKTSKFFCTKCGKEGLPVHRKKGQERKGGHLKKLYCIYCGAEKNHVEIRPFYSDYNYEDFQLEMKYHNFDDEGNRKEKYTIFRGNLKKKGLI